MNCPKNFVVNAAALIVLVLAPRAVLPAFAAPDLPRIAMMDDDKMSKKPDSSESSGNMRMDQPADQSHDMGRGGRSDDRMKMSPQGQMRNGQGAGSQDDSGMMPMMQMMQGMMRGQMSSPASGNATSGPADVTERLEGRIAFLKAELQISDGQVADWNSVADALRASRQHLLEARKMLAADDKLGSAERLDRYERHLSERLEAVKTVRVAVTRLYVSLSPSQKQTADTILLPLIASF